MKIFHINLILIYNIDINKSKKSFSLDINKIKYKCCFSFFRIWIEYILLSFFTLIYIWIKNSLPFLLVPADKDC